MSFRSMIYYKSRLFCVETRVSNNNKIIGLRYDSNVYLHMRSRLYYQLYYAIRAVVFSKKIPYKLYKNC